MNDKVNELVEWAAESCYKICIGCSALKYPWQALTDNEKEPFRKSARLHLSHHNLYAKINGKYISLAEALGGVK